MPTIHLYQPYKIIGSRHKRYESHYNIPAANVVVVPTKELGDEVLCDIRWEDNNGELRVIEHSMFVKDNLEPLNKLIDLKLLEIWSHYYEKRDN
jgi:hypothetical protein